MGTVHLAYCECGYKTSVFVGGRRQSFNTKSVFPYYCKKCGLVEVNTVANDICCSQCGAKDVVAYGHKSISNTGDQETVTAIEWGENRANRNGNLCPACKNFTLTFGTPEVFVD